MRQSGKIQRRFRGAKQKPPSASDEITAGFGAMVLTFLGFFGGLILIRYLITLFS